MPLLGWALGITFAEAVAAIDHWVAFILLAPSAAVWPGT